MTRKFIFAVSALALIAGAPNLAIAKSLKDLISPQSLQSFCAEKGLGEFKVSVTISDTESLTGTIECEAEDMPGAVDDSSSASSAEGDDDSASAEDDDEGDDDGVDGGDHHGSDHEDDSHDSSSGHDDHGSDDNDSEDGED